MRRRGSDVMVSSPNTRPVTPGSSRVRRPSVDRKCITPGQTLQPEFGGRTRPRAAERDIGRSPGHDLAVESQPAEHSAEVVVVHPQHELGAMLVAGERPLSGGPGIERTGSHVKPFERHPLLRRSRDERHLPEVQLAENEAPGRERQGRQGAGSRLRGGSPDAVEPVSNTKRSKSATMGRAPVSGGTRTSPSR